MATTTTYSPRLRQLYNQKLRLELKDTLGFKNINQVPKLEKVTISIGLGRGQTDKRLFEVASNTLSKISGQHPVETISKKSIAAFKLREGSRIGLKVTLRGDRMYEFLDRLITVVIPRLRDFHGVRTKSLDQQGNYSLGFIDQSVFPELTFEETTVPHGLEVTISTSAKNSEEGLALLKSLGMPFEKGDK